jgi:hypothetical protein
MVNDGCSDVIQCDPCKDGRSCVDNRCVCLADRFEGTEPYSLGSFSDEKMHQEPWRQANLRGLDEDRYSAQVSDFTNGSNPKVSFGVYSDNPSVVLEVTVFFVCNGAGHSCSDSEELPDRTGCVAFIRGRERRWVGLATDCTGVDEGGTMIAQVRRPLSARPSALDACDGYEFSFKID